MEIKGPKANGILGSLKDYSRDPWQFVNDCHEKYGHRVKVRMLHQRAYLLSDPADISEVLQTQSEAFVKGRTFKKLKLVLGEGLITSEGEKWKRQNRLMRPVFGIKHILNLVPSINAVIKEHCQWSEGQVINVHEEMNNLTLKIIARTLFDLDITSVAPTFLKDVEYLMHFLIKRVRSVVNLPTWIPTAEHREYHAASKRFDKLIYSLIDQRLKDRNHSKDLLQILIDARDDDGTSMSHKQIRDEIMTLLMAGHETITNTMAWTMVLLSQNTDYQEKLHLEAPTFWENGKLQESNFNKQNLHMSVIEEAMRLWPPVWAFMRQAARNIELKNLSLKKGEIVFLMPYFTQRSGDFWEKPKDFFPERFLSNSKIIPGSYLPFGLGPRMCIGKIFAQVEAKLILAYLSENFLWESTKVETQTVEAGITLRPTNNIKMRLKLRQK
ncbi:MAG: cytochrome P450 [Bacteriovoracaceae bacterium]|nr:cytochrome P450 [Bacteriovoracaceae bacterium]